MALDSYDIIVADPALADIQAAFDYMKQDSPQGAATAIDRILEAIDNLRTLPGRFRTTGRSRRRGKPIHVRVSAPFLIYYRIDHDSRLVTVTEVRHGARRQGHPRSN